MGQVLDVLRRAIPQSQLQRCHEHHELFLGFASTEATLKEHQGVIMEMLKLDPYLKKSVVLHALLEFDKENDFLLSGGESKKSASWARREAVQVKSLLMHVLVAAKRTVTGTRLSLPLHNLVVELQRLSGQDTVIDTPSGRSGSSSMPSPRETAVHLDMSPKSVKRLYHMSDTPAEDQRDNDIQDLQDFGEVFSTQSVLDEDSDVLEIQGPDTNDRPGSARGPASGCMVKVIGGSKMNSTMSNGPGGFWVATFKDGSMETTEFPNLLPCGPVRLRRRPAAAKRQATDTLSPCGPVRSRRPVASAKPRTRILKKTAEVHIPTAKPKHKAADFDLVPPAHVVKRKTEGKQEAYIMAPKYVVGIRKKKCENYLKVVESTAALINAKVVTTKKAAIAELKKRLEEEVNQ